MTGERTPVRRRLEEAGIPSFWNLCKAAEEFRGTVYSPLGDLRSVHFRRKLEIPTTSGRLDKIDRNGDRLWYHKSLRRNADYSLLGELTDQGRITTSALGRRLRKLYVEQLGFLPSTLEDDNVLYIRFPFLCIVLIK